MNEAIAKFHEPPEIDPRFRAKIWSVPNQTFTLELLRNLLPLVQDSATIGGREVTIKGFEISLQDRVSNPLEKVAFGSAGSRDDLSTARSGPWP